MNLDHFTLSLFFHVRIFFPQSLLYPVLPQDLSATIRGFSSTFFRGSPLPVGSGFASSAGFHPRRLLNDALVYLNISPKVEIFPNWNYYSKKMTRFGPSTTLQYNLTPRCFNLGDFFLQFLSPHPPIGALANPFPKFFLVYKWLPRCSERWSGFRCRFPP